MSDGTVRETESPERSISVWQEVRAAARSRRPHASVSSYPGTSAQPAASCSTSETPTGSAPAHVAILSTSLESSSGSSPTTSTSSRTASWSIADAAVRELLRHPFGHASLRDVVDEQVSGLRARLGKCRVLLQLRCDQSEHGVRRGTAEVRGDRLRVRGLPALHLLDDHEPAAAAEEAHRVAGRDRVVAAGVVRGQELDALLPDPVAQTAERTVDLRPVSAGDQIDRLELRRRHLGQA